MILIAWNWYGKTAGNPGKLKWLFYWPVCLHSPGLLLLGSKRRFSASWLSWIKSCHKKEAWFWSYWGRPWGDGQHGQKRSLDSLWVLSLRRRVYFSSVQKTRTWFYFRSLHDHSNEPWWCPEKRLWNFVWAFADGKSVFQ